MSRRLLVLTFHAPPQTAVGGLRWFGLSNHLVRMGWRVRLITASSGAADLRLPDAFEVKVVPKRTTVLERYKAWRREQLAEKDRDALGRDLGKRSAGGADTHSSPGIGFFRGNFGPLVSFPDDGRGWVQAAARAVRASLKDFAPDIVVSTGPPHSVHLAAGLGLARCDVPWVVDYRDPWMTPPDFFFGTGWNREVLRRLERTILERAASVVTTTPELAEALKVQHTTARLRWIPNGVDLEPNRRSTDRFPGLSVAHVGSVYLNRDPTPAVVAFADFLERHPDAAARGSALRFVGTVEPGFRARLERIAGERGIGKHIELLDPRPRPEALDLLGRSHVALILAQEQGLMVPAKMYEAVGMGISVLLIAEKGSAAAAEGHRIGLRVHQPGDIQGMVATLESLWNGGLRQDEHIPERIFHSVLAKEVDAVLTAALPDRPGLSDGRSRPGSETL